MDQDGENIAKDEILQLDTDSLSTFLTKEEHDKACIERGEMHVGETNDFKRGYQLVVMEVQRQISLRSREVPVTRNKEAKHKSSTRKPKSITPPKHSSKNVTKPKGKYKKEDNPRSSDYGKSSFSLEDEITKIKIFVHLTELLKNYEYHFKISTVLNPPG